MLIATLDEVAQLTKKNRILTSERNDLLDTQRINRETTVKQSNALRQQHARLYLNNQLRLLQHMMATVLQRRMSLGFYRWSRCVNALSNEISRSVERIVQEQQAISSNELSMRISENNMRELQRKTGATILFRTIEHAIEGVDSRNKMLLRGYNAWYSIMKNPKRSSRSFEFDRSRTLLHYLDDGIPTTTTKRYKEEMRLKPHRIGARKIARLTQRMENRLASRSWRIWFSNVRLKAFLADVGGEELFDSPVARWTTEAKLRQKRAAEALSRNDLSPVYRSSPGNGTILRRAGQYYDGANDHFYSNSPNTTSRPEQKNDGTFFMEQFASFRGSSVLQQLHRMSLRIFERTYQLPRKIRVRGALRQWAKHIELQGYQTLEAISRLSCRGESNNLNDPPTLVSTKKTAVLWATRCGFRAIVSYNLRRAFSYFQRNTWILNLKAKMSKFNLQISDTYCNN